MAVDRAEGQTASLADMPNCKQLKRICAMHILLKKVILVATLTAAPVVAAPDYAQSHDDHAAGAKTSATAAPSVNPAKPDSPMQCPMMKGGMAGGQIRDDKGMPQGQPGAPASKPMGSAGSGGMMMSMMADGKEMHCMQAAQTPATAPPPAPAPAAPQEQHDHDHSSTTKPQ